MRACEGALTGTGESQGQNQILWNMSGSAQVHDKKNTIVLPEAGHSRQSTALTHCRAWQNARGREHHILRLVNSQEVPTDDVSPPHACIFR